MDKIEHSYRFAQSLQDNIKTLLQHAGLSAELTEKLDPILYIGLIILLSFLLAWGIKLILVFPVKRLLQYKKIKSLISTFL